VDKSKATNNQIGGKLPQTSAKNSSILLAIHQIDESLNTEENQGLVV
jgi:hypothetical protein